MLDSATAEEILSLPIAHAHRLLGDGEESVRKAFATLLKKWHPDVCADPKAGDVVMRLKQMRDVLLNANGNPDAKFAFIRVGQKRLAISGRLRTHAGDAGEIYVTRNSIGYHVIIPGDLGRRVIGDGLRRALRFADDNMRAGMERVLPVMTSSVIDGDQALMVYRRHRGSVLLIDLINHFGGAVDPKLAAWVISGMLNIACWLSWAEIFHGDLSPHTIMVNPDTHDVFLVGPFLYAAPLGERPVALPNRTLSIIPRFMVDGQVSNPTDDLELIRRVGREMLGDPGGTRLLADGVIPSPLASWLVMPPEKTAIDDYSRWGDVLTESFGPRRFVPAGVTDNEIYGIAGTR